MIGEVGVYKHRLVGNCVLESAEIVVAQLFLHIVEIFEIPGWNIFQYELLSLTGA